MTLPGGRMTTTHAKATYYAAIKWPIGDGPRPADVQNDLEILALQLVEEHRWSPDDVWAMFDAAGTAALESDDNAR
jgi:hypothetical protein